MEDRKDGRGKGKTVAGSWAGKSGEEEEETRVVFFGSEEGVVVALALLPSVVPSLSVAVPLVLPALPPALVVVTPIAVESSGCWEGKRKTASEEYESATTIGKSR